MSIGRPVSGASGTLLVCLVVASGIAVAGGIPVASGIAVTSVGDGVSEPAATANETVPHVDPDEIDDDGDLRRVERVLASGMAALLDDSATEIGDEEYELARELLGDDYEALLGKYATNAPDVDEEETAETFGETRDEQRSFSETVEAFEETKAAYERAVEEGDDDRAREIARDLQRIADDVDESAETVDELYDRLESQSGLDLSATRETIAETRAEVASESASIESDEFLETTLTAESNRTNVSFTDPATVSGRLLTEADEPVDDARIVVRAGADTVTARTDADGTFETTYRPTLVSLDASTMAVEHVPEPNGRFLESSVDVDVAITAQADSTVTLAETTGNASFGETVRAAGNVSVEGHDPGAGLPVNLTVDGEPMATAETDEDGEFDLEEALPATVPNGTVDLGVGVDVDGLAVAGSTATDRLIVTSTGTALTVTPSVEESGEGTVDVSGRLTTEDDAGIADRSIAVTLDGTRLGTLETTANGAYAGTFELPSTFLGEEEATVTVAFDGDGTNLESSDADAVVPLPPDPEGTESDAAETGDAAFETVTTAAERVDVLLLVVVTVVLLVGGLALAVTRRLDGPIAGHDRLVSVLPSPVVAGVATVLRRLGLLAGAEAGSASTTGTTADGDGPATGAEPEPPSPLERAGTALAAGNTGEAIGLAYATVRARFSTEVDTRPSDTHWEFYRRCESAGTISTEALRTLTEAYETATFAPREASASVAAEALSTASAVLDSATSTRPSGETDPDPGDHAD